MTPETLKNCLTLAHRIDMLGTEVGKTKSRIRRLDARIQEHGPGLRSHAVKSLSDPEARKAYETRVREYNGWVDQRRTTVQDHNRKVRRYSEMSGRFEAECNGRSYFPSDLETVKPTLPTEVRARLE